MEKSEVFQKMLYVHSSGVKMYIIFYQYLPVFYDFVYNKCDFLNEPLRDRSKKLGFVPLLIKVFTLHLMGI